MRLHLENCVQLTRRSPAEDHRDGQGGTWEETLRQQGLFSLKKRRGIGKLIAIFHYLEGGYRGDKARFFSEMHQERYEWQCMQFAVKQTLTECKERKFHPESDYALEQVPREAVESQSWATSPSFTVSPAISRKSGQMASGMPFSLWFYDS